MPKKDINYSNTIIYKLCCKNPEIKDIYVGHTTDFRRRKWQHKSHCNNEHSEKYNFNVYKFIRDNGNWDNWDMIMIEEYPCENKLQAERKERQYIENLNANLNYVIPSRTKGEYQHTEKFLKYQKKYRKENIQKIKEHSNEKIKCECGCETIRSNISKHKKTNKHLELMKLK